MLVAMPATCIVPHLAEVIGLDGVVGHNIEGLEVHATVGDHHPTRLAAQWGDAAAHQLQYDLLILILEPAGVEALIFLVQLHMATSRRSINLPFPKVHPWPLVSVPLLNRSSGAESSGNNCAGCSAEHVQSMPL